MAFRPEWYKNDRKTWRSWGGGVRNWSALRLIATVTIAVWVVQLFLANAGAMGAYGFLMDAFALRAWTDSGAFNFLFPVQIFTYMLLHSLDIWHVAFNLLYLWFFGRELEPLLGKAGFLRLYILGGIVGGTAQWLFQLTAHSAVPTVGASGAVYAVMVLFAFRWPRQTIILLPIPIPIPIMVLVGFKVISDFWGFASGTAGNTAVLAHLGGAFVGYLWFRRGDVVARVHSAYRREKNEKKRETEATDRREMDRILAKIQASGLTSLSSSERSFLERRSRDLRKQDR